MADTLSQSQDEFADLPDIVDFSIIQVESNEDNTAENFQDDFAEYDLYNEHDPFAGLDLDAVPGLGVPRSDNADHDHTGRQRSETQSQAASDAATQYTFDELDDAAVNELNIIEMRDRDATTQDISSTVPPPAQGIGSAVTRMQSTLPHAESQPSPRQSMKRKRSDVTCNSAANKKVKTKGKASQDPHASARTFLSNMEGSVSCSICYEIFSEPHVSSPCGHSFCAECVVDWMKKKIRSAPKCPLCRTPLTQGLLVAPNFTLKDAIEKYVTTLAECGCVDWQSQGQRYIAWTGRNARWSTLVADLRDLQRRRWNDLDEPSQDSQFGLQQITQDLGELTDGESSDDDLLYQ